jgi:hypothetical protein
MINLQKLSQYALETGCEKQVRYICKILDSNIQDNQQTIKNELSSVVLLLNS